METKAYRRFTEYLGSPLTEWTIHYRVHATQRMFKRHIQDEDVGHLLDSGEVIEEYHDDFPFPSFLINGLSTQKSPLHGVVGVDFSRMQLYVITVYEPAPQKWSKNYSRRTKQ